MPYTGVLHKIGCAGVLPILAVFRAILVATFDRKSAQIGRFAG